MKENQTELLYWKNKYLKFKNYKWLGLAGVAQVVGASSCAPKGCRFYSRAGRTPGWGFGPWSGTYGRRPMAVSLTSMFLSLSLSLPLPLSLESINISLDEDFKKL